MNKPLSWQYDEFRQVGKDYGDLSEVERYDSSHSDFRDLEKESLEVFKKIGLSSKDILVDFGCGTGTFAVLAAERCSRVFAVDVSKAMLDFAEAKAKEKRISNMSFVHSGFLNYEREGDSPTIAASTFSLHHLPDFWKAIALKKIHKLLAKNGRFYLRDVVLEDERPLERISAFIEKQAQLGGDFLKDDAEGHFKEEYSTYDWILESMLDRCGFRIDSKEMTDGVIASYLCSKTGF